MSVFEELGIDIGYVLLGVVGFSVILFLLVIILFVKNKNLKKNYKSFMSGSNGKDLEEIILSRFSEIDFLKLENKKIKTKLEGISETLLSTYQKIGIVKYDAFKEMGGKLSFSLALLNDNNDGFIINSMHSSREGCYTYIKEILKGESYVVLAEEEKLALEQAINSNNYME
ncbi:DUF4446 family protein [Anaerocolumna aminovalerica]|jgi:hypothetical protein|uniref:DUF4446 domain-containing protein n=1 Tax=Anaerocolumna aminovalerica TaxID=1527 RepID=A0A1I5HSP0_9FIRM|nr:DUF4446 family protein [Anaerocolumna aminovalerica]MBU5333020.1 DUF4446 family protein [Anaerocolumna aminovalerica]MDU6266733.1 DUF4446 family protein [Anaerocolumna aminovalerica]SFO51312.1 Protein of unknown function [Anaerocolumna aminovalerica]